MPVQSPQWTEFLSCPICYNMFNEGQHRPISLGCGHTVCKFCLAKLQQKKCPFDQAQIMRNTDELPVNFALLQLVGVAVPDSNDYESVPSTEGLSTNMIYYTSAKKCIEELAMHLKPMSAVEGASTKASQPGSPTSTLTSTTATTSSSTLSRPMQRKLVLLVSCQLVEEEGRARAMRAARSLGERTVTELILQHQNPQQLSANLWAAVRARGCQFLGPAMQEEVLKLILLALEDGSALSRKVLVLFVVQRLESQYPQASKTAIGHVVQLLYRASCFKVTKREEESSLMQLKEEFRTYDALRREHDSQIVQIATEAGLRIAPDQWSSLLYGDAVHKPHMQSIIDKLQTPQSFSQGVNELVIALQRSGDPGNLSRLRPHLDLLANIDPNPDAPAPSWENLDAIMKAVKTVVEGHVEFITKRTSKKLEPTPVHNPKFKTSMCRDIEKGSCPRGTNCTFAHTQEELEKYRARNKKFGLKGPGVPCSKPVTSSALTPQERLELAEVCRSTESKLLARHLDSTNQSVIHIAASNMTCLTESDVRPRMSALRQGVSVPIAKPSPLPMSLKTSIANQTIYTSATPAMKEHRPNPVPIPHKVSSAYSRMEEPQREGHHTPGPSGDTQAKTYAYMGSHGNQHFYYDTKAAADDLVIQKTMMLPPNPYTNQSNHYKEVLEHQGAVKVPEGSSQLVELHKRRLELLSQLKHTKHHLQTAAAEQHGVAPTSTSYSHEASPPMMSKSLADSLATTHTTMSLDKHSSYANSSGSSPVETQIPWSGASSVAESIASSFPTSSLVSSFSDTSPRRSSPAPYSISSSWPEVSIPLDAWESVGKENFIPLSSFQSLSEPLSEHSMGNSTEYLSSSDTISARTLNDMEDEFVPFEHTVVSKYGPISRMAKVKPKNTGPVRVTAAQSKGTNPVTAVTPHQRPHPIPTPVPSRFQPRYPETFHYDHRADPYGLHVASSLPTALMKSSLINTTNGNEMPTLWALRDKVTPGFYEMRNASRPETDQICQELLQVNQQIENLRLSEDERLARELQAVELNIQETERKMKMSDSSISPTVNDAAFAQAWQDMEMFEDEKQRMSLEARKLQEAQDKRLAEQIVLDEARRRSKHVSNTT